MLFLCSDIYHDRNKILPLDLIVEYLIFLYGLTDFCICDKQVIS